MPDQPRLFVIGPEVQDALATHQLVIALETAVLTHGLPEPENLELMREICLISRERGVVPAVIGLIEGTIKIGLSDQELEFLAHCKNPRKISRRDFSIASASGNSGGTTVSGTLFAARHAGIQVFATGGIGGVHRGNRNDISADLPELSRTPMIVVCSGAKAILDLPATREFLETMGIPVLGYKTNEMPSFFSPESGLDVDLRVDSCGRVCEVYDRHRRLGMESALLVVVPPPPEFAIPRQALEETIQQAVRESEELGIQGAGITPFLLKRVSELSSGESLAANLALLKQNAKIACEIARGLDPRIK